MATVRSPAVAKGSPQHQKGVRGGGAPQAREGDSFSTTRGRWRRKVGGWTGTSWRRGEWRVSGALWRRSRILYRDIQPTHPSILLLSILHNLSDRQDSSAFSVRFLWSVPSLVTARLYKGVVVQLVVDVALHCTHFGANLDQNLHNRLFFNNTFI